MGFLETLTLIFIVLKLAGIGVVADWTWVSVFTPLIISGLGYLIVLVIFLMLCFGDWAWGLFRK
jgi:hypothetical protein